MTSDVAEVGLLQRSFDLRRRSARGFKIVADRGQRDLRSAPVQLESIPAEEREPKATGSDLYLWLYGLKELLWALRKTRATTLLTHLRP